MPKKKPQKNNLKLAGIFIAAVLGLIFLSFLVKLLLVINDSKFDGKHKFNILISASNGSFIVSLNPESRSISTVNFADKNIINNFEIPIDGAIQDKGKVDPKRLSILFLKSEFPFGQKVSKLTFFDLMRLALFSRTISSSSFYERSITSDLTASQINTIISLTFTDPTIYKENQTIEIINSTQVSGLGAKLANFISNIGGNPILVSNSDSQENRSKIIYYGKESYTVKKLSSYFSLYKEQHVEGEKGIADVIIVIGKDLAPGKDN